MFTKVKFQWVFSLEARLTGIHCCTEVAVTVTVFWSPHSRHGLLAGQLRVGPHSCHAVVVDHTVACPEQLDSLLMSTTMAAGAAPGAAVALLKGAD